jgi:Protein of unknown function (DUF2971)
MLTAHISGSSVQPPAVLYKYLPPERIALLESMSVRFSNPNTFNDAFDTQYLVPKAQCPGAVSQRFRYRNKLGILCLTERADNHLMWVNYAGRHTGFVVGFNARASFFHEGGRVLRKVSYEQRPRVFPNADLGVCLLKSSDWKYEQEWRCVREFEKEERRDVDIDPNLIAQIVFGSEMQDWNIARIMQWTAALDVTHVKFFRSSPVKKSWTFQNVPKSISLCHCCNGAGYSIED